MGGGRLGDDTDGRSSSSLMNMRSGECSEIEGEIRSMGITFGDRLLSKEASVVTGQAEPGKTEPVS